MIEQITLSAGTLLQGGKYRIEKVLGQGGFGVTYRAEQIALKKVVAVKEFFMKDCCERGEDGMTMTVGTAGSQRTLVEKFKNKFVREAQLIAGMDHPNIVRVTDVFEENGTAYYVMDMLEGGSLNDKVKTKGPLSESVAEKYIRQVADALSYIHSKNTVHLDVKPSNILLNAKGDAVLIDFGISKHYDSKGEQTSSTPVGISKGYAPLEQSKAGDVAQFSPATDIYALGSTLYFLVTGNNPPDAADVYEDGLERPKGLSDRIWTVIEKAMQPRRKDRPQSVAAFLTALDLDGDGLAREKAKDSTEDTAIVVDEETVMSVQEDITDVSILETDSPAKQVGNKRLGRTALFLILATSLAVALIMIFRQRGGVKTDSEPVVELESAAFELNEKYAYLLAPLDTLNLEWDIVSWFYNAIANDQGAETAREIMLNPALIDNFFRVYQSGKRSEVPDFDFDNYYGNDSHSEAEISSAGKAIGIAAGNFMVSELYPMPLSKSRMNDYIGDIIYSRPSEEPPLAFWEEPAAAVNDYRNAVFFDELSHDKDVRFTEGGLAYKIIRSGDGLFPERESDTVRIDYVGRLINGDTFDSADNIELSLDRTIEGFRKGLMKIDRGGKIMLYIPPEMGYGKNRMSGLPANSTLIFEVSLLDVKRNNGK